MFDLLEPKNIPGNRVVFFRSFLYSGVGIFAASALFRSAAGLVALFLFAFSLTGVMEYLLAKNRDDIWNKKVSPARANIELAISMLAIFLGVFAAYSLFCALLPDPVAGDLFSAQLGIYNARSITDVEFSDFTGLLGNNLKVLLIFFLFGIIYETGGLLFILAWNASVWGSILTYTIKHTPCGPYSFIAIALGISSCVLPHLLVEATGYVLCGMARLFLGRGWRKYGPGSNRFARVFYAVTVLLVTAVAAIAAGAILEAFYAPWMIKRLFFR